MNLHQAIPGPIGVLCGGPSQEREISIRSGRAVHAALLEQRLPVELVILSENENRIPDELRAARIKSCFVALHGPFGEDGTVQSILEEMGLLYTGSSVEACRYAMDKVHARRRWRAEGLPVPQAVMVEPINALTKAKEMSLPLVVKPRAQGSSYGMSIVDTLEEVAGAVEAAAAYGQEVILEEYLPGPEVTVGILEDRPLPVVQVVPKRRFYDTVAKYTPGQTEYLVPAPLPPRTTRLAQMLGRQAHEALGCHSFSRVDMILAEGQGPVILELNPIPGMTESSLLPKAAAAAGIAFQELCSRMLASALGRSPARGERGSSLRVAPQPAHPEPVEG